MNEQYVDLEKLPAILNAKHLEKTLGISRASVYKLMHSEDFPTVKVGKRMLVPRDKFFVWLEQNTGGQDPDEE